MGSALHRVLVARHRAPLAAVVLPFTNVPTNTCRTAQRVKAAQRPEGLVLTQRRDTTTRYSLIGK
jgi:hypothetical protein